MAQKITPSKIVKHARELIIKGIESGDNSFVIFDVDGALERLEHYRCQLKSFSPTAVSHIHISQIIWHNGARLSQVKVCMQRCALLMK